MKTKNNKNNWSGRRTLISLFAGMVIPAMASAQSNDSFEYQIGSNDTLGSLAEKIESFGGTHNQRRKLIQDNNPHIFVNGNPSKLRLGSVVSLKGDSFGDSSSGENKGKEAGVAATAAANTGIFEYRIQRGDTLSGLAEKIEAFGGSHFERRKLIRDSNPHIFVNSNQDQLRVGSVMELVSKQADNSPQRNTAENAQAIAASSGSNDESEKEPKVLNTNPAAIKINDEPKKKSYLDKLVMSPNAKLSEYDGRVFGPDPDYGEYAYDAEAQKAIYGGKRAVFTPRPLLELGRPQYQNGPLTRTTSIIGDRNQVAPALAVYGDFRTATAFNDNGGVENDLLAARLNLDIDLKLTGTERLHAFVRPLDKNNQFTRISINDDVDDDEFILDGNLETLFFEGDLGAIVGGLADVPSTFDLPFSVGLMPLLFQNGVWLEDAFTGLAFTIPARNSRRFDISNFDITFFAGFDKVSSQAIRDEFGQVADDNVNVYGVASFWELLRGYAEVDYAFIDGRDEFDQFDHHNFSVSFSKRFRDIASSSFRVISTFGQDLEGLEKTAGGTLLLWENSLITSRPSTFIPYMNFFAGFDRPQSVARDNGGLLKTVGINFESDALTGYPLLDDTGQDVYGGAIGIQNLFSLDQQLVVELAGVKLMDDDAPLGKAKGDQLALGIRYQRPLSRAWLIRADAIKGWLENDDNIDGIRFEIRRKF